ncbi:MAG: hypothetical protein NC826_05895 [Candidatus Omnitrophica bacterium]|nr:hypothetical protein [Candidatus Omnitrophota bacterium]
MLENMEFDVLTIFFIIAVVSIYIPTFILSLIFTFSTSLFQKIEQKMTVNVISNPYITTLDKNITYFSEWLTERHYIIGPFMAFLSFYNIVKFFEIIHLLK